MDDITFDRLIDIQSYTDAELKNLAQELSDQEREISKQRRLLHGQLDILRAEMVRRSRDKQGSGEAIFRDGDISALTAILSGRGVDTATIDAAEKAAAGPEIKPADRLPEPDAAHRDIRDRFRDLSASVVDERLLRYIAKQVGEGRKLDDIMADEYVVSHANEVKRAQLLENPHVLKAIEDEIKKEFADYDSETKPKTDDTAS